MREQTMNLAISDFRSILRLDFYSFIQRSFYEPLRKLPVPTLTLEDWTTPLVSRSRLLMPPRAPTNMLGPVSLPARATVRRLLCAPSPMVSVPLLLQTEPEPVTKAKLLLPSAPVEFA